VPNHKTLSQKPYLIFVEHDYYIRELYKEILASPQLNLLAFSNILPALKAIRKYNPPLVFVDVDLPGGAALKILKQIDQGKIKTKVVLLSNFEGKDVIRKYLGQQIENVIETTHANPDEVTRLVYKILAEHQK